MTNSEPRAGWVSTRPLTRASIVKDSQPEIGRHPRRPGGDVAGQRPPAGIGHQIQHAVAAIAGAARRDDLDEAAQPPLGILLGKPSDLGIERRFGLALDEIGAGPVDEQQDAQHRGCEHQEIERGEAKGMRPHQPPQGPENLPRQAPRLHGGEEQLFGDHRNRGRPGC